MAYSNAGIVFSGRSARAPRCPWTRMRVAEGALIKANDNSSQSLAVIRDVAPGRMEAPRLLQRLPRLPSGEAYSGRVPRSLRAEPAQLLARTLRSRLPERRTRNSRCSVGSGGGGDCGRRLW